MSAQAQEKPRKCGVPDSPIPQDWTVGEMTQDLMYHPRHCQCCHTKMEIKTGTDVGVSNVKTPWLACPTCNTNQCPAASS